jgi:hypothetical protein
LRVDQDDLDRHNGGVYVQHAFVRRDGTNAAPVPAAQFGGD